MNRKDNIAIILFFAKEMDRIQCTKNLNTKKYTYEGLKTLDDEALEMLQQSIREEYKYLAKQIEQDLDKALENRYIPKF
jgi:uncharacterized protein YpiB (UPF0302 family)